MVLVWLYFGYREVGRWKAGKMQFLSIGWDLKISCLILRPLYSKRGYTTEDTEDENVSFPSIH